MTLHDFGSRIQAIREDLLKLKQDELAKELGTSQALISRLEAARGGNIILIFDIVTYLNRKGLPAHLLFREDFSIEEFSQIASKLTQTQNAKKVIEEIQASLQACMKNTFRLENMFYSGTSNKPK